MTTLGAILPTYQSRMILVATIALALTACGREEQAGQIAEAPRFEIEMPDDQLNLLAVVLAAQKEARSVENDMQLGGVKARRDKALCRAITKFSVRNWQGEIKSIDSNSDGKGVLELVIAPDVVLKTWNNAISDIGSDTLISPESPLFDSASRMRPGQRVLFSGSFLDGGDDDCLREASLRLRGKVTEPEFIFRFAEIFDYETARVNYAQKAAVTTVTTAAPKPPAQQSIGDAAATAPPVINVLPASPPAATAQSTGAATTPLPAGAAGALPPTSPPTHDGSLYVCDTTKHRVLIDRDPNSNLVRYRSWNRPKAIDQKPDMEVQPGEIVVAGTGTCRSTTYRFKTGNVAFEVNDSTACVEARPPENAVGELMVLIGGEVKSQYWCLR